MSKRGHIKEPRLRFGDEGSIGSDDTLSEDSPIASIRAYWVKAPLSSAYHISSQAIANLDLMFVKIVDSEGRIGIGESCPLWPYHPIQPEAAWQQCTEPLEGIIGHRRSDVLDRLVREADGPYSSARGPAVTALEMLGRSGLATTELRIEVVGTVQSEGMKMLGKDLDRLVMLGHRTVKMKLTGEPAEELRRVEFARTQTPDRVTFRLDGNEGWDFARTEFFLNHVGPERIEFVEQPVPRHRWDWIAQLNDNRSHVPLMLDESIASTESIRRASDLGVKYVKLKLNKAGSLRMLRERMELASELGLEIVVGNGAGGAVETWHEALVAGDCRNVGEMNGSLKLHQTYTQERPSLDRGCLVFRRGLDLRLREDALLEDGCRSISYGS